MAIDTNRLARNRPAGDNRVGEPTAFNVNEYSIAQHQYPEDLYSSSDRYGKNYVIFYVNVHENSYLVKENKVQLANPDAVPPRLRGFTEEVSSRGYERGAAAAVTAATVGAKIAEKAVGEGLLAKAGNVAIGAGASLLILDKIGKVKAENKRIKTAIALHMPTELASRYTTNWDDIDSAFAQATFFNGGETLSKVLENNSLSDAFDSGIAGMDKLLSAATGAALATPGVGTTISKTSGVTGNPKKEQVFKSVDFRTFTFTYMFYPKTADEARNVQNIIKQFKLHMHPEYKVDSDNFLYLYPSEFDIYYYHGSKENEYIHRHTSCVLTDMNVLYTPQGVFNSLKDGMPSQINVNLTFRELALLSKEAIEDGF